MKFHFVARNLNLLLLVIILTVSAAAGVVAQTPAARPDRGARLNSSYAVSDIENISLQNGNVNLNIPLAMLPPLAGSKLSFGFNAYYNSKIWDVARTERIGVTFDLSEVPYVVDTVQQSDRGGWRVTGQYGLDIRDAHQDFDYQIPPVGDEPDRTLLINSNWYKVVLVMPDGAEHELRPVDYLPFNGGRSYLFGYYKETPSTHGTMRYYSYDGSYLYATITSYDNWTVYLPDGTRVSQSGGIQRIEDTNNNKIKIFTDSTGTHYQDEQTGREIRYFYDPAGNNGKGQGQVWYQAVGGTWMHIDINFDTTNVQGKLYRVNDWVSGQINPRPCTHQAQLSQNLQVVREIVFPQTEPTQPARRFTFTYNSDATETATTTGVRFSCSGSGTTYTRTVSKGWGSLSKLVTPSSAEVQYAYELDSGALDANSVFSPDDIPAETITKKTIVQDGPDDVWTYVIWPDLGSASQTYVNDNSVVSQNSYPQMAMLGSGFGGDYYGVSGLVYRTTTPFQKVEQHWANLIFSGAQVNSPGGTVAFNPVVDAEYTTLTDAAGNNLKMSAKTMQYDFNGNVTQTTEYDWFDPGLVSRDGNGVPTAVPAGATVLRVTNNSYYNVATSASSGDVYAKRSAATGTPLILNAPQQTTLGASIVQLSYDGQAYGVAPTVGNLTTKKVWNDLDSKWITTSNTYGLYGNLATATDARGKVTQFYYDDATHALPNRVVTDPQNGTGTQTTTTAFDYYTGLVTSQTDVNGQVSTVDYTNQLLGTVDPFGRPGVTKAPAINIGGTNQQRRVTTTYLDSSRQVIVASDLNGENDKLLKTRTTTDQLGRPVLTEQTEDGTNYTISARNAYLDMGRVMLTSNAMRSAAESSDGWTRVTKDAAGRVTEVATFGGANQPAWSGTSGIFTGLVTTVYDANFTTVTDQAGKLRRSMTDAIGRLRRVDEPDASNNLGATTSPVQPTNYSYDVFGNLLTVTQGSQTRSFSYDSLSRLRTAVNPESGTVSYQYDDGGHLLVKTDARGVSSHFEYDAINRVTRRWYNGSNLVTATTHNSPALPSGIGATDEVKFYYDSQTLPAGAPSYARGSSIGRLVAQTYGLGSNGDYYAYDVLGRATLKYQQTGTVNYSLSAAYNLAGAITALTYPSGHTVTNTYDPAGRLSALNGNLGDGTTRTYSTGILYSPAGALVKEQFGTTTPIYNKLFYNSRGQLAEIRESTSYTGPSDTTWDRGAIINSYSDQCTGVCSGSSMTDNNGNLKQQELYIPGQQMRWQQYAYDSLNRLDWAREVLDTGVEQWKQQFTYDRWGNRTINTATTYGVGINNKAFTVNTANNRLGVPSGQLGVMSYDAAGNLTNDTYTGAGNRTYDAENKITSAWGGNNQAQLYSYDAGGQRIKRTVDGITTWQVYGFGGELIAEYAASGATTNPQKEYGYRNGQLLVTTEPGTAAPTNVALAANGATVTASSSYPGWGPSGTINGDRKGLFVWQDGAWSTNGPGLPAWLEVQFNGSKTISEIDVVTLQDNYNAPIEPTESMTFTLYGMSGYDVQYWNGAAWVTISGGSITGNNRIWRKFSFAPVTTTKIRVLSNAAPDNTGRITELEAWTGPSPAPRYNLALAATATASSIYDAAHSASAVINGDRKGLNAGYGGNWQDAPPANTFPDWVQLDFGSNKMINEVDVFSLQDNWTNPAEPTESMTFTLYGMSGFDVQYWDGSNWVTVPGGAITGNNKIWRKVTFASVTTSKIRVLTNAGPYGYSVFTEIEAYGPVDSGAPGGIHWLITDHLGTPRMIFDQSGSLANTKRHDYLPFGEELFAPAGGRTTAQGYAAGDGIRQHFTAKERDPETGLDYFGARYLANVHGRFTSPDPLLQSGRTALPQSWHRYAYALNNPLRLIDPDGLADTAPNDEEQKKQEQQKQQPQPQQSQVVDLRKDKIITAEVNKIRANAQPLAEGVTPVLSNVRVVVGETASVNNGTVIDGYGNYTEGFTGVVRPVAYIPLNQNGDIIEGNGIAVQENVRVVSGDKPRTTDEAAPTPKGGVFIDSQLLASGQPTTTIQQAVFVGQFPRSGGAATSVFRTGVNEITKNADARTVSVKLGPTQRVR